MTNALYYGDNLSVLRESIATESIDLILDPPFNSNASYNVLCLRTPRSALATKGGKKGMDRGIDGYLHFRDADKKPQFAVISVKGGGIKLGDVRDLKGTMEREKAALGLFLTLNEPTREMEKEAASAGLYETGGMKVPKLQILTAAQIQLAKNGCFRASERQGTRDGWIV